MDEVLPENQTVTEKFEDTKLGKYKKDGKKRIKKSVFFKCKGATLWKKITTDD